MQTNPMSYDDADAAMFLPLRTNVWNITANIKLIANFDQVHLSRCHAPTSARHWANNGETTTTSAGGHMTKGVCRDFCDL